MRLDLLPGLSKAPEQVLSQVSHDLQSHFRLVCEELPKDFSRERINRTIFQAAIGEAVQVRGKQRR